MKKLLLSTALVLAATAGAALAEGSVLERVIGSIDNATNVAKVNGTFANIADNIGVVGGGTVWSDGNGDRVTYASIEADYASYQSDLTAQYIEDVTQVDTNGSEPGGDMWQYGSTTYATQAEAEAAATAAAEEAMDSFDTWLSGTEYTSEYVDATHLLNNIDGSISNTLSGLQDYTAQVGDTVMAIDPVKVDIGDLSTTVLGAVNTGDITLGVNQNVTEAIAGSSSAVSNKIDQLGGTVDTGALVLNVAANSTSVLGNVQNTFAALNGSVGNVSTTVLGAVNTGTITSGVNAAVTGIQSGIVGTN